MKQKELMALPEVAESKAALDDALEKSGMRMMPHSSFQKIRDYTSNPLSERDLENWANKWGERRWSGNVGVIKIKLVDLKLQATNPDDYNNYIYIRIGDKVLFITTEHHALISGPTAANLSVKVRNYQDALNKNKRKNIKTLHDILYNLIRDLGLQDAMKVKNINPSKERISFYARIVEFELKNDIIKCFYGDTSAHYAVMQVQAIAMGDPEMLMKLTRVLAWFSNLANPEYMAGLIEATDVSHVKIGHGW